MLTSECPVTRSRVLSVIATHISRSGIYHGIVVMTDCQYRNAVSGVSSFGASGCFVEPLDPDFVALHDSSSMLR